MKFAVYAALIAVCAAEHESEEMKAMDDMKDMDDKDRMDDKGGKDDSESDGEKERDWCEYSIHVFTDDMCMDKPDDGMMMHKVGGCIPFDMVRDTLFLNTEELAKRAAETGSPDIFPKSVRHRCNNDFNANFYADENCND